MADMSRVEGSRAARVRGMVKNPWKAIKAKLRTTHRTEQPTNQEQAEIDPSSKGLAQVAPSPWRADTSLNLSAPENNSTCASLSGLSGLRKLKGDHILEVNNHQGTVPRRRGIGSDDSIPSNVAVVEAGESDSDSGFIGIVQNQTQNPPIGVHIQNASVPFAGAQGAPIQHVLAQNLPAQVLPLQVSPAWNTPVQVPANQIGRKVGLAKFAINAPAFTPAHPHGTPGLPLVFPPVNPIRQSMLLDLQRAQQNIPVNPANLLLSTSPVMIIPSLGPSPKQTASASPNIPGMPPTPLKLRGRIPEAAGPGSNILVDQPLHPRSPRPRAQHDSNPVPTADGTQKHFGIISNLRVAKNQLQPRAVKKSQNERKSKEETPWEKVDSGADHARDHVSASSEPVSKYPEPIYVGGQKYYVGGYLGGGGTAKVYSVVNRMSMKIYALKVIKRKDLEFDDLFLIKGELTVMRAISEIKHLHWSHKNGALVFVNHLVESWYDKDCIYFVMPLCVDSLHDHLRGVKLDPLTIKVYAAELMSGLEALHDMRIIHCDIKPDNILVSPDGHLTISDFGLSVSWLDSRYHRHPPHAFRGCRLAGTDGYMAPEIVSAIVDRDVPRRGNFGFAADIWSLGLIFAELGMGGRRFVSLEDEGEQRHWGDFKRFAQTMVLSREMLTERIWENLRGSHAMLVERMLEINEADRANFDEIASHPFFSGLDFARVLRKGYPVPIPPLERVLPCRHTNVDELWFREHSHSKGRGEPLPEDPERRAAQSGCLTQDIDLSVIPEVFVWDIEEVIQRNAMRSMQQAAARSSPEEERHSLSFVYR